MARAKKEVSKSVSPNKAVRLSVVATIKDVNKLLKEALKVLRQVK